MRSWRIFNDARSAPIEARIGKTRMRPVAIGMFFAILAMAVALVWLEYWYALPLPLLGVYYLRKFAATLNRLDKTERLTELTQIRLIFQARKSWRSNFTTKPTDHSVIRN